MAARIVARDPVPDGAGDKAERGAGPERAAPAIGGHEPGDELRRDAGAEPDTRKDEAVGFTAFDGRNPAGDDRVGGRIDDRFPSAETEPDEDGHPEQAAHSWGERGDEGCEDGPPDSAEEKDGAGAETVGEPASRCLASGVTKDEGAEDEAELLLREMKLTGDRAASYGDVDAIEVGDGADDEDPEYEEPADWKFHRTGNFIAGCGRNHRP